MSSLPATSPTSSRTPVTLQQTRRFRRLVLHGFVAIALTAAAVTAGMRLSSASIASPICTGCFAAEVSTPALQPDSTASAMLGDYGSVVLYKPESWDAGSQRNVDAALALLPATVRGELGNPALGPVYVTVNRNGSQISGKSPYGRAANFFSTTDSTSQVVLYPSQPVKTILHELGHAYNLRSTPGASYGQAYLSPELQDFMSATGWRVLTPVDKLPGLKDQADVAVVLDGPSPWTDLTHNDPLEDFANSFALYFAQPSELQRLSPGRYEWFAGHFAE